MAYSVQPFLGLCYYWHLQWGFMAKKKQRKKQTPSTGGRDNIPKRAAALAQKGRLKDGIALVAKHLEKQPGWAMGYTTLGDIYLNARDLARAFDAFREAAGLDPNHAHNYYQMGVICFQAGKMPEAAQFFEGATSRDPKNASAWRNLAIVSHQIGAETKAAQAYVHAYGLEPRHEQTQKDLAVLLAKPNVYNDPSFIEQSTRIEPLLCTLLERKDVWHQGLAPLAGSLLCERYADLSELDVEDRLARVFLRNAMNVQLDLESVLKNTRRLLLQRVCSAEVLHRNAVDLLVALALQCFHNEYIWDVSEEEAQSFEQLPTLIDSEDKGLAAQALAAYGMYRPIFTLDHASELAQTRDWKSAYQPLIKRTLLEPLQEHQIRSEIETLTPIHNNTSLAVQEQYEEHPFPRWLNLSESLTPLSGSYAFYMKGRDVPAHLGSAPEVLIAGCGTGQHPLSVARANGKAKVIALDLSKASLAYATRKARELKIPNVELRQADILQLASWERRFDHIESVGVLHHMQDPLEGWRVLRGLLRDGGTMRIGLYSELARKAVVEARDLIARLGIASDSESIARFRARLIEEPELGHLKQGLMSIDFFSTSMLRDLIFHVSEHRYMIPRLIEELNELGLTFLGFELPGSVYEAYQAAFPDDPKRSHLENWHKFEEKHPSTFSNMYNFWVQTST